MLSLDKFLASCYSQLTMNPNVDINASVQYNDQPYMSEYFDFMSRYKTSEVAAEDVGEQLARLAQYYAQFNLRLTAANRRLVVIAQDIESRVDENGKPISSTKAKVFVEATPEAEVVAILKTHLENVDMFISSLRSLQKGLLNEYSHMGNT